MAGFGGVLSTRALDLRLAYDEIRDQGSALGCGAVIVLGTDDCLVAAVADVMTYFECEKAKQCGARIRGTGAMRWGSCGISQTGPQIRSPSSVFAGGRRSCGDAPPARSSTPRRWPARCGASFPTWSRSTWSTPAIVPPPWPRPEW